MKLSIIKEIGNGEIEKLIFSSETTELNCENAKQIAIEKDAVFKLDLVCRIIKLKSLVTFLNLDKESQDALQSCFTSANMIEEDKVSVSHLSISCHGRVKISINAPEIDSGIAIASINSSLKIGLGFTFQAGIRFNADDIQCDELKFVK